MKKILSALLLVAIPVSSFAAWDDVTQYISLQKNDLPASDLVQIVNGKKVGMTSETALEKERQGLDLSTLDPDDTTISWKSTSTSSDSSLDDALPVQSGDAVTFAGQISNSDVGLSSTRGRYIFNIQIQNGNNPPKTMTAMISEKLHSYLVRKELLRKLGYEIPAVKWLPKVQVTFSDILTKGRIVGADAKSTSAITNSTAGSSSRWVVDAPAGSNPLTVTMQDLVVYDAQPLTYALEFGPPVSGSVGNYQPEQQRIFKALAIVAGLTDIPESINQVDPYIGYIQNNQLLIKVDDVANFSCGYDDAVWISNRIAKLTRQDFADIVKGGHYPDSVAQVLTEKLIARRNNLMQLLGVKVADIPFNLNINVGSEVAKGKIVQESWTGYASRFAWGDPESPLKGLGWFALSTVESNVIDSLFTKINNALPQKDTNDQINAHDQSLLNDAIQKFQQTGQAQTIPRGLWTAPIANGTFNVSRYIVLGNYLGTNNLIQLADTVAVGLNAGLYVGSDNMPTNVTVNGLLQAQFKVSLTHLKPLSTLKQAIKEPLKETLVPILFKKAADIFADEKAAGSGKLTADQIKKRLGDDIDQLTKVMDIGESLILTESVQGIESMTVAGRTGPVKVAPTLALTGGLNQLILSRLYFYRKDTYTIQVFKDKGELDGVNLALEFTVGAGVATFPMLSFSAKKVWGSGNSDIFDVDIHTDPAINPKIYAASNALSIAFKTGSVEALRSVQQPSTVSLSFSDSSTNFNFLHYVSRNLKQVGKLDVTLPDGTNDHYISIIDGYQSGANYQQLATETANYIVQRLTQNAQYSVSTQAAEDPGRSIFGHSYTRQGSMQAQVSDKIQTPFVQAQYRWEGYNITAPELINLVGNINQKYGFVFYPSNFLSTTQNIQLYQLTLNVNIYEDGLKNLVSITPQAQDALVAKYKDAHNCPEPQAGEMTTYQQRSKADYDACMAIDRFVSAMRAYRGGIKDITRQARAIFTVASQIEQFVSFTDLVSLAGGINEIYVYSQISGFRVGSEALSDPIPSNAFGCANSSSAVSCTPRPVNANGVLNSVENTLGINDGEFYMQWIRDVL